MKSYKIKVEYDTDPMNPRTEWDNIATMICFHNRYNLGDKHNFKSSDYSSWSELKEVIESQYEVLMIKPLYLYDHSGITISTSPFGCQWDSGQVGWVFIDKKQLQSMTGDADGHTATNLEEIIDSEVKTYDSYIQGEVYSYQVIEVNTCDLGCEHETIVECCGGYYSEEDAEQDAESLLKHYQKEVEVG